MQHRHTHKTGEEPDIPASAVRIQGGSATYPNALWIIADGYGEVYLPDHLTSAKVEWLKIGDSAPISLTGGLDMVGSTSSQTINGSAFNDTINGKGGNDTLIGGSGDDTYVLSGIFNSDTVTELASSGNDTIHVLGDIRLFSG